jgi:serine/threonine protein kinase HipA of HipAB toxin-antitoxin module
MSTVAEIEAALKRLPAQEAQNIAQWLQKYLEHQGDTKTPSASQTRLRLPDYAARRRTILGDKVLPNMVLLGREQERW